MQCCVWHPFLQGAAVQNIGGRGHTGFGCTLGEVRAPISALYCFLGVFPGLTEMPGCLDKPLCCTAAWFSRSWSWGKFCPALPPNTGRALSLPL